MNFSISSNYTSRKDRRMCRRHDLYIPEAEAPSRTVWIADVIGGACLLLFIAVVIVGSLLIATPDRHQHIAQQSTAERNF